MAFKRGFAALTVLSVFFCMMAFSSEGVMLISSRTVFHAKERADVCFPHDRHSSVIKCESCHHYEDGFPACGTCHGTPVELMRAFHGSCIRCHRAGIKTGQSHGPVLCGECHNKKETCNGNSGN